ncbi:MAG: CvpA family protein [Pseudomonadota bacterium]
MTIFDYLVVFIFACSTIIGAVRGLVKEVLSLLSWVLAFVIANTFSEDLAVLLPSVVPGLIVRLIVAFAALFIGTKFLMWLLMLALDGLIKASVLNPVDRGLGALFGFARGALMVLAIVLVCAMTAIPRQPFWKNALFSPLAESAAHTIMPFLPGSFAQRISF